MKLCIGCDHAGFALKTALIEHLNELGHEVCDVGTFDLTSCHYPEIARKVAERVASGEAELGILTCGTGIGMSIAANKVKGIRAAAVSDCFTAEATRRHNDANILCMGERAIGQGLALTLCDIFISTPFEGGRHQVRVDMINQMEEGV